MGGGGMWGGGAAAGRGGLGGKGNPSCACACIAPTACPRIPHSVFSGSSLRVASTMAYRTSSAERSSA